MGLDDARSLVQSVMRSKAKWMEKGMEAEERCDGDVDLWNVFVSVRRQARVRLEIGDGDWRLEIGDCHTRNGGGGFWRKGKPRPR